MRRLGDGKGIGRGEEEEWLGGGYVGNRRDGRLRAEDGIKGGDEFQWERDWKKCGWEGWEWNGAWEGIFWKEA